MLKRVFIIHGWGGSPDKGWFVWLKKELFSRGFEVHLPVMPNAETPKINEWVSYLSELVGKLDKNTYFIGHSIGCQAIMRYLEKQKEKAGGVLFIAGWFNLTNLEQEEVEIVKSWIESKIDLNKVKKNANKIIAIFSDNDPYAPLKDSKSFKEKLNAKIIIEKNKGHYIEHETGKIPVVLEEFLKLSK